ncbi:hypothetical protein NC653_015192 [Populus alba x Populus x berolinensis]|uniref:Uncharacterized protein n=1 Tax=Populus alba x Populus x berolinensis TaxID=444605 RepID=A0AAD6QJW8_9ROSI|nr:hypothetical protein NC653_015192 [Populus alba x Populus x berolinensis]
MITVQQFASHQGNFLPGPKVAFDAAVSRRWFCERNRIRISSCNTGSESSSRVDPWRSSFSSPATSDDSILVAQKTEMTFFMLLVSAALSFRFRWLLWTEVPATFSKCLGNDSLEDEYFLILLHLLGVCWLGTCFYTLEFSLPSSFLEDRRLIEYKAFKRRFTSSLIAAQDDLGNLDSFDGRRTGQFLQKIIHIKGLLNFALGNLVHNSLLA